MEVEMRGSVSSAYLLHHLNNVTILHTGQPVLPLVPGFVVSRHSSTLIQPQHSELREHLLDLETISNIFLILHSQDQHSLSMMGCWIYAQLCLFRPAGRKFNIAKVWMKSPQWAFNVQHLEFKPQFLS